MAARAKVWITGLALALAALWGTEHAWAGDKMRVCLVKISGTRDKRLKNDIIRLINQPYSILKSSVFFKAAVRMRIGKRLTPPNLRRLAKFLKLGAIIDGILVAKNGRYKLVLKIRDGRTGAVVERVRHTLRKKNLSSREKTRLRRDLISALERIRLDSGADRSGAGFGGDDDDADDLEGGDDGDDVEVDTLEDDVEDDVEKPRKKTRAQLRAERRAERRREAREARERRREARAAKRKAAAERRRKAREARAAKRKALAAKRKARAERRRKAREERRRKRRAAAERRRKARAAKARAAARDKGSDLEEDDLEDDLEADDLEADDLEDDLEADDLEDDLEADDLEGDLEADDLEDDLEGDQVAAADDLEGDDLEDDPAVSKGGEPGRSGPAAVVANAGLGAFARTLSFESDPALMGTERPIDYEGGFVPSASVDVEIYPMVLIGGSGTTANIGIDARFEQALQLVSKVDPDGGSADNAFDVDTSYRRFGVGLRYRLELSPLQVGLRVGYGQSAFELDKGAAMGMVDIPNTKYSYVDPGVTVRYPMGKLSIDAGARFLAMLSAGEIQESTSYGQASILALDGGAGVHYLVTPSIGVRLGARFTQMKLSFTGTGDLSDRNNDDAQDVDSATDRYLGGYLTASYQF